MIREAHFDARSSPISMRLVPAPQKRNPRGHNGIQVAMKNKRVLITGASRGIGLAAAVAIAKEGAQLVLVVRDPARGEEAKRQVLAAGATSCDVLVGDLSVQADVRQIAKEYKERWSTLDVLVNNAGAIFSTPQLSKDGHELTLATNHLSYFLLTNLLLDVLKASAPSRIVNVSSEAHKSGRIDFADLESKNGYSAMRVYGTSKLMNILFTKELAKRLEGTGVTANSLHPGVITTGFGKNNKGLLAAVLRIAGPFMKKPEEGAKTTVYLATSADVERVSGEYFQDSKKKYPSRVAQDADIAARLWSESEKLTSAA